MQQSGNPNNEKITLDNGVEAEYSYQFEGKLGFVSWRDEDGAYHYIELRQNYENPDDNLKNEEFIEIVNTIFRTILVCDIIY